MAAALFADRFLLLSPERAVDLASGDEVWIRRLRIERCEERDRWLCRCAALAQVFHPNIVALADYGAADRSGCFEAWCCPPPPLRRWRHRDPKTTTALRGALACLSNQHEAVHGPLRPRPVVIDGRPCLLPVGEAFGDRVKGNRLDGPRRLAPLRPVEPGKEGTPWNAGLASGSCSRVEGGAAGLIEQVAEVFDCGVSGHPRSLELAVPAADVRAAVLGIARCARLHGYIPVSSRLLADRTTRLWGVRWREWLRGRHVAVLRESGDGLGTESGLFFLSLGLENDRPHVLLTLGARPSAAARPTWPTSSPPRPVRAREESAPYAVEAVVATWQPTFGAAGRDNDQVRRSMVEAAANGRHAQVERWLREAAGRCARRRDSVGGGEAQLALGRLLMQRGQLAEASKAFAAARHHFEEARLAGRAVEAGVFTGLVLTDGGRLCDAESALRAAVAAARAAGDGRAARLAGVGLARCLIWQGRHEEALVPLGPIGVRQPEEDDEVAAEWRRLGTATCARERPTAGESGRTASLPVLANEWPFAAVHLDAAQACLHVRASLALGDLGAAGRAAAAARAAAAQSGSPLDLATVSRARALLCSALGDLPAVRQQVDEGLHACRLAHDPLRALRLRLLLVDALLKEGAAQEARSQLLRLGRLNPHKLPPVVGRPLERLLRGDVAGRGARPMMACPGSQAPPALSDLPRRTKQSIADSIIEVLACCQSQEDERDALRQALARLRSRLGAASVMCAGTERGQVLTLASDGNGRPAEAAALRAIQSGLVIPPSASQSGIEASASIRFRGEVIGAIACRWTIDARPDWPHGAPLLSSAATALAPCVRALLDRRAMQAVTATHAEELLGVSAAMASLRAEIARAARAPFPVLIEGESGSGKELVARAIHRLGARSGKPLCALNCAALTDDLIEAELFGHARGAFTGAMQERKGLFEEAHQGTLVLDEVGELTPRAQAKLLRAIQEGEVRRLGENVPRPVDVRIVAATNRPLRAAVESGAFRQDLLYRLEVIRIAVPPLRDRVEDVPVLAAHFWREATSRLGSRSTLAPATVAALTRYHWPGNVRELQNVIAALAVAAGTRTSVGPEKLPALIAQHAAAQPSVRSLEEARRVFEVTFVRAAIARAGGRRAQAAADLGMTRQGLAKIMARLGISED